MGLWGYSSTCGPKTHILRQVPGVDKEFNSDDAGDARDAGSRISEPLLHALPKRILRSFLNWLEFGSLG